MKISSRLAVAMVEGLQHCRIRIQHHTLQIVLLVLFACNLAIPNKHIIDPVHWIRKERFDHQI